MSAIRESLPSAVALVVAAAPVLAPVLLLVTTRPARVAQLFLLGWAVGIVTVAGLLVAFVDMTMRPRLPPTISAITRIVLGVVIGVLAVVSINRSRASDVPPGWLASIMTWSAPRACAVGFALGSINPKSLALVASGATAILGATTRPRDQAVAIAVFAAVGSLGVAVPVVLRMIGGTAVNKGLERAGRWMTDHGQTLSVIVLAIVAVVLFVGGVRDL